MATIEELSQSILDWSANYKLIVADKYTTRSNASTVDKLGGRTPSQLLTELRSSLVPHLAAKDNPHGTTADDLNVYIKSVVNAKLNSLLTEGMFPITCLLDIGSVITYTKDTLLLTIDGNTFVFNGYSKVVPTQVFELDALYPGNYENSTFYIYVKEDNGVCSYSVSKDKEADTSSSLWVGSFQTDAISITTVQIDVPIRIGNYRLSETSAGQAIPVTSGSVLDTETLAW